MFAFVFVLSYSTNFCVDYITFRSDNNEEQQRRTEPEAAGRARDAKRLEPQVCFIFFIYFIHTDRILQTLPLPNQTQKADDSLRRPTQGPRQPRRPTMANDCQCRAHDSPQKPMQPSSSRGGLRRDISSPRYVFFRFFLNSIDSTYRYANEGQRRPMETQNSQHRPTQANESQHSLAAAGGA